MSPQSGPPASEDDRVALAERILGADIRDKDLLRAALTHPSRTDGVEGPQDYQRLEFLGDSILGFLVADYLYRTYPELTEGAMTKVRSAFVAGATISRLAESLGVGEAMITGASVTDMSVRPTPSLLADCFEALLGALYLDRGLDEARAFLFRVVTPHVIAQAIEESAGEDPKNVLQEHTQAAHGELPVYEIVAEEGPPHDRAFTAEVSVGGNVLGRGIGPTKKDAQRNAAREALMDLDRRSSERG